MNHRICIKCIDDKIDKFCDIGKIYLANQYEQIKYQMKKEANPDNMMPPPLRKRGPDQMILEEGD